MVGDVGLGGPGDRMLTGSRARKARAGGGVAPLSVGRSCRGGKSLGAGVDGAHRSV